MAFSNFKKKIKKIIWKGVVENKIKVVVGARSSLFLPFAKLGIIIVDEEHDASYKQDEGIFYNARDMAISRGSFEKTPVLLITSIPSVETFNNIIKKKYSISKLNKRYQDASMPNLEIINLNNKKKFLVKNGLQMKQWKKLIVICKKVTRSYFF